MSGWGIAETAPVIEKIKAESADYLRGLNSCGEITWSVYDKAFDFYMELISRAYEQGKKDAESERKTGRWDRLMMYLADLQLTYAPMEGHGYGDEKLYEFITGLIEELEGWEDGGGA